MSTVLDFSTLLYKKALGNPSTLDSTASFSEPNRPALPAVLQTQIYAQQIPPVAPADIATVTTDDNGANIVGSYAGRTSTASSMIRKYVKIPLTVIPGSQENAYEAILDVTYGRVMQDTIPYNTDPVGSYLFTIYRADGTTVIPFGQSSWVWDTTAGVLTFYAYDAASLGISAASPPVVSFYRYVGVKGAATAQQTQSQITGSTLTYTKPQIFDGGSTTASDDTLAAIILDDRNLANLSSTVPCMSLDLGGSFDQSWRICIFGAVGEPQGSSFQIQVRTNGTWVTKTAMFAT